MRVKGTVILDVKMQEKLMENLEREAKKYGMAIEGYCVLLYGFLNELFKHHGMKIEAEEQRDPTL